MVDETSRAPSLDEATLQRLVKTLDRDGVVAAMLIETQGREPSDPLSEVDIAVWHDPELDPQELQVQLAAEASHAIGVREVDLVMLNHASPLMRYTAIRDGARFIERNHDERVRLETRAILDYLDTAPLRELASGS